MSQRGGRGGSSDNGRGRGGFDRGGRGGGSDRGGRGRGRHPASQVAPSSPLLKSASKPLLSESFLRFPRVGEIQYEAADIAGDNGKHSSAPADEFRSFAILDGILLLNDLL
jgi:hypothetical protein